MTRRSSADLHDVVVLHRETSGAHHRPLHLTTGVLVDGVPLCIEGGSEVVVNADAGGVRSVQVQILARTVAFEPDGEVQS